MRTTILYFILSFQWQISKRNNKSRKVTNGVSLIYMEYYPYHQLLVYYYQPRA